MLNKVSGMQSQVLITVSLIIFILRADTFDERTQ